MGRPTVVAGNASAFGPDPDEPTREFDTAELDELDGDDAPPGSVLAQLRARAEVQRKTRTLDLPVGGAFGDELVIRYRVLDRAEWDKYAVLLTPNLQTGADNLPPMSVLNVRMMAAACLTVLYAGEDLGVRLDGRLAELIGHPLTEGMSYDDLGVVEVVEGLFPSPMAITTHSGRLVTWMQDPSDDDDPGSAEGEE